MGSGAPAEPSLSPPRRWLVVANPAAGQGRVARTLPKLQKRLEALGISYRLHITEAPGDAARFLRQQREQDFDLVAVVGGDGTVREAASALLNADMPLLVVPLGSGNDFSRVANCNLPWTRVLEAPWQGTRPVRVDVGYADLDHGREIFVNGAGVGFDACVVENMPRFRFLKGDLWYLATVLYTFRRFQPPQLRAEDAAGRPLYDGPALLFSVGNGRYLGGGFHLFPRSSLRDGRLDVSVVSPLGFWNFLKKLPKVFRGTHLGEPEVLYEQLEGLQVTLERPFPVQMDGELPGRTRTLRFGVLPQALTLWPGCRWPADQPAGA